MKKIIVFLLFTFCVIEGQAQELKWFTDVKEAVAIGNKEKKPLMLFFTGTSAYAFGLFGGAGLFPPAMAHVQCLC